LRDVEFCPREETRTKGSLWPDERGASEAIDHRVPSAACQCAAVPCASQSHSPAAGEAAVST